MAFLFISIVFFIALFVSHSIAYENAAKGKIDRWPHGILAYRGDSNDFNKDGNIKATGKNKVALHDEIKEPSTGRRIMKQVGSHNNIKNSPKGFPLSYPFISWGEANYIWDDTRSPDISEEGFHAQTYFEQSVDWIELFKIRVNTFAAFEFNINDDPEDYWYNNVGLWLGAKAKYSFKLSPISWGLIAIGARAEMYKYTASQSPFNDDHKYMLFEQWSFGGDWRNLKTFSSRETHVIPLGYPFLSWGEVSYTWNKLQTGWLLDCYFEQGIDWFKLHDFVFNTFTGLTIVQSDDNLAYWYNKISPRLGIKIKRPFRLFGGIWAQLDLGVRGEYDIYTSGQGSKDLLSVIVYLQWAFGGDWKTIIGTPND